MPVSNRPTIYIYKDISAVPTGTTVKTDTVDLGDDCPAAYVMVSKINGAAQADTVSARFIQPNGSTSPMPAGTAGANLTNAISGGIATNVHTAGRPLSNQVFGQIVTSGTDQPAGAMLIMAIFFGV